MGGSGNGRSRLLSGDGQVEAEVMVLLGLLEAFFATNRLGLRSDGFQDGSCDIGKQADSSCGDASTDVDLSKRELLTTTIIKELT